MIHPKEEKNNNQFLCWCLLPVSRHGSGSHYPSIPMRCISSRFIILSYFSTGVHFGVLNAIAPFSSISARDVSLLHSSEPEMTCIWRTKIYDSQTTIGKNLHIHHTKNLAKNACAYRAHTKKNTQNSQVYLRVYNDARGCRGFSCKNAQFFGQSYFRRSSGFRLQPFRWVWVRCDVFGATRTTC